MVGALVAMFLSGWFVFLCWYSVILSIRAEKLRKQRAELESLGKRSRSAAKRARTEIIGILRNVDSICARVDVVHKMLCSIDKSD